jgi:hypothetical protein
MQLSFFPIHLYPYLSSAHTAQEASSGQQASSCFLLEFID